jgi:hypothetical protein
MHEFLPSPISGVRLKSNARRALQIALLLFLTAFTAVITFAQEAKSVGSTVALDAYDNLAVTADESGTVRFFDASTPSKPTLLSAVIVQMKPSGVALAGRYALVSGSGGIQIIDVSEPKSPVLSGFVSTESVTAIAAAGNLVTLLRALR